jgi:hypothetical protein
MPSDAYPVHSEFPDVAMSDALQLIGNKAGRT